MNINKPDLVRCFNLLNSNFSLITVSSDKIPNIKWKKYQSEIMDKDTFENFYNLNNTDGVGIVTGYDNLEVIDIDLKVFSKQIDRDEFWNEYLSFLRDNIFDFDEKFVIVKTRNAGFHILYKNKNVLGNKKIATLEKMQSAVIESRGVGGYVWIYDRFILGNSYSDIKYITDSDRIMLWSCSKSYNFINETKKDYNTEVNEADVKPWDDYNSKNRIIDLIQNEFEIIRKLKDKLVIKRNGAKSPHSGYIFDNSGCMYLFSTGTLYPSEKLITPFEVLTIQKFAGDFKACANFIYNEGYGSRIKPKKNDIIKEIYKEIKTDVFPIDIFPDNIQNYIYEVHKTLNASIDYLGCSLLWVLSLSVGNSMKIEIKKGWVEAGILWIAIIGKAGIGKSHNIDAMTFPLVGLNQREIKLYSKQLKNYKEFMELSKKEKQTVQEVQEPTKTQFIVGDITMESFFDYHSQNLNGIGILRDELSGWIKDLNKYRQGSDLETFLSCWSNQQIMLTRKTASSAYVPKAYVPIIGGVQPSIFSMHYTEENKDNGFIDRWLLCYPDLMVEQYNESEMTEQIINWYSEYIVSLFDRIKNNWVDLDEYGNQKSYVCHFSKDAKKEWIRIFNKITDLQNSEDENEYMKSILPKQKSYLARFALLLNVLNSFETGETADIVTKKSILDAEKLSDYFIKMAKKNKLETIDSVEMKTIIKNSGKITAYDKFEAYYKSNPNLNKSKIADELNVSRVTINNWVKKCNSSVK